MLHNYNQGCRLFCVCLIVSSYNTLQYFGHNAETTCVGVVVVGVPPTLRVYCSVPPCRETLFARSHNIAHWFLHIGRIHSRTFVSPTLECSEAGNTEHCKRVSNNVLDISVYKIQSRAEVSSKSERATSGTTSLCASKPRDRASVV